MEEFVRKISKFFSKETPITMGMDDNNFCSGSMDIDEETEQRIQRLDELTKALNFGDITTPRAGTENFVELNMESGTAFMIGLHKSRGVAVSKAYFSPNSVMSNHFHKEWLFIVVWKGRLEFKFENGQERTIEPPGCIYIEPDAQHSARAPVETWAIVISIPPSPDFPDGPFPIRSMETFFGIKDGT